MNSVVTFFRNYQLARVNSVSISITTTTCSTACCSGYCLFVNLIGANVGSVSWLYTAPASYSTFYPIRPHGETLFSSVAFWPGGPHTVIRTRHFVICSSRLLHGSLRSLTINPLPHSALQAPHSDHSDNTTILVQTFLSTWTLQSLMVCFWISIPHVVEKSDQAVHGLNNSIVVRYI